MMKLECLAEIKYCCCILLCDVINQQLSKVSDLVRIECSTDQPSDYFDYHFEYHHPAKNYSYLTKLDNIYC